MTLGSYAQMSGESSSPFTDEGPDGQAVMEPGESSQRLETDILDRKLGNLNRAGFEFSNINQTLREICVRPTHLPAPYLLSNRDLEICEESSASGGFSTVYKGKYRGEDVCVKRLRVARSGSEQAEKGDLIFLQEVLIWRRLDHSNIVPFIGVTIDTLQIVSEWMPGGDLPAYIRSNPGKYRVPLLIDIANGLDYLHSHGVIHGDLKGPNILVDVSGHARIMDFGISQDTLGLVSMSEARSPRWTAPEILDESGKPSREGDVFSFAMVMIEIFTGEIPFSDRAPLAAIMAITRGERPEFQDTLPRELWGLIQRCWDHDSRKRPPMVEVLLILDHPTDKRTHSPWLLSVVPGTPTPVVGVQQLQDLDPSDKDYRPLLHALLNDSKLCNKDPEKHELMLIELLDRALDHLPVTDDLFRKALRRLQSTCSNRGVLPQSYLVLSEKISDQGEPFAAGHYADVRGAIFDERKVCIKYMRSRCREKTFYGVVVWKRLQHPNIVPLLGVLREMPFDIIYEWMGNGRITEYVRRYPQVDCIRLLRDVAEGLHYLHSYNLLHGDLKSANVLIDGAGHARLADSGFTSVIPVNNSVVDLIGANLKISTTWAAPEISKGGVLTKEGDVFTFAVVAVETFLQCSMPHGYYADVLAGSPERPEKMSLELWNLVQKCWDRDSGRRPSSFELVSFFRSQSSRGPGMLDTRTLSSGLSGETLTQDRESVGSSGSTVDHWDFQYDPRLQIMRAARERTTNNPAWSRRFRVMNERNSPAVDKRSQVMKMRNSSAVDGVHDQSPQVGDPKRCYLISHIKR